MTNGKEWMRKEIDRAKEELIKKHKIKPGQFKKKKEKKRGEDN